MNARAIKKIVMKNCLKVIWGERAYATIRVPMDKIECPHKDKAIDFLKLQLENINQGYYATIMGDFWIKETPEYDLFIAYDGFYGRDIGPQQERDGVKYFTFNSEKKENNFAHYYGAFSGIFPKDQSEEVRDKKCLGEPIAYKYFLYKKFIEELNNSMYARACGGFEKGVYFSFSRDLRFLYIQFSVKWRYSNRKFGLCSALSKFLKQHSYVKILRGSICSGHVI
jgi:hypothetical protein